MARCDRLRNFVAAHRKSDRRRDDLCAVELRKRAQSMSLAELTYEKH
jgi:hypothetical protein